MDPPLKRIRVIHQLRSLLAVLLFGAFLAAASALWWTNHTGLPNSWRNGIESSLESLGLHADLGSLRIHPLRGIEARNVTLFSDSSRLRATSRIQYLNFDIDRSRLARGRFQIDKLKLSGARISLLADPTDPDSPALEIEDAHARIALGFQRRLQIIGGRGRIGGIPLALDADLYLQRPEIHEEEVSPEDFRTRRELIVRVVDLLEKWAPSAGTPPQLRVRVHGDLEIPESLRGTARLAGGGFRVRQLEIDSLDLQAKWRGSTLALQRAQLACAGGSLDGWAEYNLAGHKGEFRAASSLPPRPVLEGLGIEPASELPEFIDPPQLELDGKLRQGDGSWDVRLVGRLEAGRAQFRELALDRFSTSFSWDGNRTFLEDLRVGIGDRRLEGRAFLTPESIRYSARGDLPLAFWQRAVTIQPLSRILDDFSAAPDNDIALDFRGSVNRQDRRDWTFIGSAETAGVSFRGVPTLRARVDLDLSSDQLDFTNGAAEFDYRDYPPRKAHDGPLGGLLEVGRIRYDRGSSTIEVENLRGDAWPGPVLRTFAPGIAEQVEEYGFHRTPTLTAAGIIGLGEAEDRLDLEVGFSTRAGVDVRFLDRPLTLHAPRGNVRVRKGRVALDQLSFDFADGHFRADFEKAGAGVEGAIDWTEVALPALSRAFEFESDPGGRVTGRLEFTQTGNGIQGLAGRGHLGLEQSELFEVPIFGPLSPLISAVLDDRKAGFEEAESAFFSFSVADGLVETRDFLVTTPSLVVTGDGSADLVESSFEMTLRMNARGLLGILTLPLKPFYGLIQFRGSGPLSDPRWRKVMFTSPPEDQEQLLLDPPRARKVTQ